jgi:hypothetical protein
MWRREIDSLKQMGMVKMSLRVFESTLEPQTSVCIEHG